MSQTTYRKDDPLLQKLLAKGLERKDPSIKPQALPRASILVPLFWSQQKAEWHVLLTQRPMNLSSHPGEVCFPGGRQEEQDGGDDIVTALRETEEEVDISRDIIQPICRMETIESVHGLCVTPIVAVLTGDINPLALHVCPTEVEAAFSVPISYFWNEQNCHSQEELEWRGGVFVMRYYYYQDPARKKKAPKFKIWGLTAHVVYQVTQLMRIEANAPKSGVKTTIRGPLYRWMDEGSGKPYWAQRFFVLQQSLFSGDMHDSNNNGSKKDNNKTGIAVLHQYENERKANLKSETATKKNRLHLDREESEVALQNVIQEGSKSYHVFTVSSLNGRILWKLATARHGDRDEWIAALSHYTANSSGDGGQAGDGKEMCEANKETIVNEHLDDSKPNKKLKAMP
jgi:8-oxo-dGTP pyrophosphatase MutT (NUDIX family)